MVMASAKVQLKESTVLLRAAPDLFEDLARWTDRLNSHDEGPRWTRAEVMRVALRRALRERGEKGELP